MRIIAALLLGVFGFSSPNVAGTWTGHIKETGQDESSPAYIQLQQEKDKITGVTGPSKNMNFPIKNALLLEDHLTFTVHSVSPEDPSDGADWTFDLKIAGDSMEGTAHAVRTSDNHSWDMTLKVNREK